MNPNKANDRRDLMSAVEHSREKLGAVRESRRKLLKRTSGSEWYANGADERTPINQIAQAERSLVQHLIGGDPQAQVIASDSSLMKQAYEQTLALNKVAQLIGLRRKMRRIVRDAVYGMGICRIGMTKDRTVPVREIAPDLDEEAEGAEVGVGRLMLEVISLESWVHDCLAETLEDKLFCGHAYWVEEEDIEQFLPGVAKKDLMEEEKRWIDERGGEMAGAISRGTDGEGISHFGKRYWLWDLWLPRENVVITTQVKGTGEIAAVKPWSSRPGGPYMFLQYLEIPDQAMPKSVLADLVPVHDSLNSTFRKLIDQTRAAKTVLGFKPGNEDDAQRIVDAASFAVIQMRDPEKVREFNFNGPDQALLGMLLQTRELASILGGNTDMLAGLGSQSPTLGQEQIIQGKADSLVMSMEAETMDFARELFEAIRWYLYHEQQEPIPIVKKVQGTDINYPGEWSAGNAGGVRFDAYLLAINPETVMYSSPEQTAQKFISIWNTVIMPALQLGVMTKVPDMDRLVSILSQYLNLPELDLVLRSPSEEEQAMAQSSGSDGMRQSPNTTRTYVRRGSPGPTRQGNAMQAMQMMGAGKESQ
jgi:hypothetical protein